MNTFDPFTGFPTTPRSRQRTFPLRFVRWTVQMFLFCFLFITVFFLLAIPLLLLVVGMVRASFLHLFFFFLYLYGFYRGVKWWHTKGRKRLQQAWER